MFKVRLAHVFYRKGIYCVTSWSLGFGMCLRKNFCCLRTSKHIWKIIPTICASPHLRDICAKFRFHSPSCDIIRCKCLINCDACFSENIFKHTLADICITGYFWFRGKNLIDGKMTVYSTYLCIFFRPCPYTELRVGDISSAGFEKREGFSRKNIIAGAMARKRGKYGTGTEKDTGRKDRGQGGAHRSADSPDRIGETGTGGDV